MKRGPKANPDLKETRNCCLCGKQFLCYKKNKQRFCSLKCSTKATYNHPYKSPNLRRGERHYNWKGGISPERKRLYKTEKYKLWRTSVFERDNYTCVLCFSRGVVLNADHIRRWADYPELRFDVNNGRTLCVDCHRKTDTFGIKSYNCSKRVSSSLGEYPL